MKATDEITVHNVYVQGNLHFNGTCKKLDIALERVSTKDILEHSVGKTKLCLKEFSLDDLNKLIFGHFDFNTCLQTDDEKIASAAQIVDVDFVPYLLKGGLVNLKLCDVA
ncbi:hypothetical protein GCK72_023212 [Caenorhabditis remanei]|uniref:Uncharacterized protein n=1 Tax=Caenorhabditis remanei TaxID=31234 RepID=A0A6A5FW96_CAERE|nr:hypothetical protein GCK72_023212 [Caenorhabditis remanei]KAF1746755.1 hypothetical protein GCK72_023212 [Caenorhabditis remanei]